MELTDEEIRKLKEGIEMGELLKSIGWFILGVSFLCWLFYMVI